MRRLLSLSLVLLLGYTAVTHAQVWMSSRRDAARPAGAIVVLGAAQYDGRPSPVLQARLDHAVALYREGLAPLVVVTGSNRPGDRVTEASASATYLHANGVPDEHIRREVQGTNTYDQIAASRRLLQSEGIADAVLVSDPLHSHRLALTARETGLVAHVSPRPIQVTTTAARLRSSVRETVAVGVGRIVGFRRLRNLQGELRGVAGDVGPTAGRAALRPGAPG